PGKITTRLVWNLRSINEDHGAYWQNEEEFVQPLLRELDVVGGDPSTSRFAIPEPAGALDPTAASQRRRQRVSLLELWRRATLFVLILAWFLVQLAPFAANAWNDGDLVGGLASLGLDDALQAVHAIGLDGVLVAAIGYFLVRRSGPDWRPSPVEATVLGVSV